ncbi:hypothetical protein JKY72_01445 [Candidatus Gracilibacteria bacterium]|nr:hypothetical protein [Candidatus Gracilibacteria bacterium]
MRKPEDLHNEDTAEDSMEAIFSDLKRELKLVVEREREKCEFLTKLASELPLDFTMQDLFCLRDVADEEFDQDERTLSITPLINRLHKMGEIGELSTMIAFLGHDVDHLTYERLLLDYIAQRRNIRLREQLKAGVKDDEMGMEMERNDLPSHPDDVEALRAAFDITPQLAKQIEYPYGFLKTYAEMQLGSEPEEIEIINLKELVGATAHTVQLRYMADDYVITTPETLRPDRNQIILDLEEAKITSNTPMMWSIFHNLVGNAAKELSCSASGDAYRKRVNGEGLKKTNSIKIKVEQLAEQDVTLIHVSDTGQGLSADEIMNSVKIMLKKNMIDESGLKVSVRQALRGWKNNHYAIRSLRMGDVYDLAGLSRVSGFSTRERTGSDSSGLGLWGVNFLAKQMGGGIIPTNTLDQGALFTVVIPNNYFSKGDVQKAEILDLTAKIRAQIESGEIPVKLAA